jgi:cob(I)alamin adenosyltransferase
MERRARVLLFTGDGKGKTTAALGMALRACGHGMPVFMLQFVKADGSTGEIAAARKLPDFEIIQTGLGFLPEPTSPDFARHRDAAERGLHMAAEAIASRKWRLVILDEACFAVARGLLKEEDVCQLLRDAPPDCLMVLTGRGATPGLIALADTVTEMKLVKHAYETGIKAQEGVEF